MSKLGWLEHTMRWYGPSDAVSLRDIRQSGCTGVVTALHQIPVGEVWESSEVFARKALIETAGMSWTVIESLPVHEDIKRGNSNRDEKIEKYQQSTRNVAQAGIKVITYNFMPVLDWLRTDLSYEMPDSSTALRFERAAFIAFDLFMLNRPSAESNYSDVEREKARAWFDSADEQTKSNVYSACLQGLPGSRDAFTPTQVLDQLDQYEGITPEKLRENLLYFLNAVCPVAEECEVKLAVHPDDPPYPVLGLPRIISTAQDIEKLLEGCPSPANGLCFCTGSYGARADNDIPWMIEQFGDKVHFLHLRNTKRDAEGNFFEADHLEGDIDMVAVMTKLIRLMAEEQRSIPMRPDHGHLMMDDMTKPVFPGYGAIGRMRGLAELRGLEKALQASFKST